MRGLNSAGNSLLSQAINLCNKPGAFIRSLQALEMELTQIQTNDINWEAWFDHHFKDDRRSRNNNQQSTEALEQLRSLIKKASAYEPAFADVLMLGQRIDCKEALGLDINLHKEHTQNIK